MQSKKTICYLLISIQASCGSDDHVAECESTEEAKTGNNKPFFCWQSKGRKSLWGEGLSQIDVNISLKSNDRRRQRSCKPRVAQGSEAGRGLPESY